MEKSTKLAALRMKIRGFIVLLALTVCVAVGACFAGGVSTAYADNPSYYTPEDTFTSDFLC
jgi:hypothetical protein